MNMIVRPFALVLFAAMPLASLAQVQASATPSLGRSELSCGVTDLPAFERFVGGKPTVSEFRAAYSCLTLVLPGEVSSRELRNDNSRYFADVDGFGRVVGGHFQ